MPTRRTFIHLSTRSLGGLILAQQLLSCEQEMATIRLSIQQPSAGDQFVQGDTIRISWMAEGIQRLTIEYSQDEGSNWNLVAQNISAVVSTYDWGPIDGIEGEVILRLLSLDPPVQEQQMREPFLITPRRIEWVTAFEDLYLMPGQEFQLEWLANSPTLEPLELLWSTDDGATWTPISDPILGQTSFLWEVPEVESTENLLQLRSLAFPEVFATSSNSFQIRSFVALQLADHPEIEEKGRKRFLNSFADPLDRFEVLKLGQGDYAVLSLDCPHFGCTPDYSAGSQQYQCPCHGSVFTQTGCLVRGPAPTSMFEIESNLSMDQKVVRIFFELKANSLC